MDRCPICNNTGRPMIRDPHEKRFVDYVCIKCAHQIQGASGSTWYEDEVSMEEEKEEDYE